MAIHITGDEKADEVLDGSPFALLLGMLLDQQYPMEHAFRGPAKILDRFGSFWSICVILIIHCFLQIGFILGYLLGTDYGASLHERYWMGHRIVPVIVLAQCLFTFLFDRERKYAWTHNLVKVALVCVSIETASSF